MGQTYGAQGLGLALCSAVTSGGAQSWLHAREVSTPELSPALGSLLFAPSPGYTLSFKQGAPLSRLSIWNSVGLRGDQRTCVSTKFPVDGGYPVPGPHFENH